MLFRDLEIVFGFSSKEKLCLISNICDERGRETVVMYMPCVYLRTFPFSKSSWYLANMLWFLHFIGWGKGIAGEYSPKLNLLIYLALVLFVHIHLDYLFMTTVPYKCLSVYSFPFPLPLWHFWSSLKEFL